MGLLAKTNPAATPESVSRAAKIGAAVFALLTPRSSYARAGGAIAHIAWATLGAITFALLEWQPPGMLSVGDVLPYCGIEFAIKLATERFVPVEEVSVNDLYREVLDAIRTQHPDEAVNETEVWARLRKLIVNRIGVDQDEVTPQARFMYELA